MTETERLVEEIAEKYYRNFVNGPSHIKAAMIDALNEYESRRAPQNDDAPAQGAPKPAPVAQDDELMLHRLRGWVARLSEEKQWGAVDLINQVSARISALVAELAKANDDHISWVRANGIELESALKRAAFAESAESALKQRAQEPSEPTHAMVNAGCQAFESPIYRYEVVRAYKAMLAAAPKEQK